MIYGSHAFLFFGVFFFLLKRESKIWTKESESGVAWVRDASTRVRSMTAYHERPHSVDRFHSLLRTCCEYTYGDVEEGGGVI